jgi:predicted transcriptional regulator
MTTHTKKLLVKPPRAALISIRPCFVEKILTGEKQLEFRRSWAVEQVDVLVIYSSSPIQRIVATVKVLDVTQASPNALWELAKIRNGGVTRQLIRDYFSGKESGFAIGLVDVLEFSIPIDPKKIFTDFRPPQSFCYLSNQDYNKILKRAK